MSEMALKLIRKAKAEKWKTLDLGNCGIVGELPAELGELVDLEELVLSERWWDSEKKAWKYGSNNGARNKEIILGLRLPPNLLRMVARHADLDNLQGLSSLQYLETLDLANNEVMDVSPLQELTKLRTLNLGWNEVKDLAPLSSLIQLEFLHLQGNKIGNLYPIEDLSHLQILDIWDNQISDVVPITGLKRLTRLNLGGNQVEHLNLLTKLPQLTSLYLWKNSITDVSPLATLTNLTQLNLGDNEIVDIAPLAGLVGLTTLDIWDNQISDITYFNALTRLTSLSVQRNNIADLTSLNSIRQLATLNLEGNPIENIGPIAKLHQLTSLDLRSIQIANIRPLSTLANLSELNLSENQVEDIAALAGLANLKSLDISQNQVADITALSTLTNLKELRLSQNNVTDISPLAALKNLTYLDLSQNQVHDVRPLAGLLQLSSFDLSNNRVADITALSSLTNLGSLDLSGNLVADISSFAAILRKGIPVQLKNEFTFGISLQNCPLSNPPLEVVARGNEAILWYLDGGNDVVVREAKVLLVGEPESGKSSLYLRMFEPDMPLPKLEERTDGIDIHPQIIHQGEEDQFQLNIWDFGGQEVLLNTHQFFFSKRAVYILLVKGSQNISRLDHEYFREWLGWIDLLGGKSPILFFQNRIGGHGETIEVEFFQKTFQQVKKSFGGDLLNDGSSAKAIRKALEYHAGELTLLNSNWKERHLRIRQALEALPKERVMISWAKFRTICTENGETEEAGAKHLSNFFHEIGVCLHYQPLKEDEDELLANWVILDNQWATTGVYQMVLDEEVRFKQFGRFTVRDQKRIWNDRKYARRHEIMVRLMERFEICYPLADVKPKTWLIPQHLHTMQPKTVTEPEGIVLVVRYEYEFIPKGILNRLMTRMNRFVKDPKKAWRDGVLFEKEGASLLARLNFKHDQITLVATGDAAERLKILTFITDDLERIHKDFENILVEKWIPCRCSTCEGNPAPHSYKYSTLMRMKLEGKSGIKVQCEMPPFRSQSVERLLDGFQNENDPDGTEAKWKQATKLEGFEIVEFKGMMQELHRDHRKIMRLVEEIPVVHAKIDQLIDRLSEADQKLVEMLGLQAKHQEELIALLAGQEAILSQNDQQLQEYMDDLLESIENAEMRNEELFQGFAMALSEELQALWPKASDEPLKAEMKGKWKFAIPFIPGFLKYELEVGTDYSKAFQMLTDGLGGATDRTVLRLQEKARKVWERGQKLLGNGK